MSRFALICTVLTIAAFAVSTHAAPPSAFSYQGYLTGLDGTPINDTTLSVRFVVYSDSLAAVSAYILWESGAIEVSTTGGRFSILLGAPPTAPLPDTLFADSLAWVGVQVGDEPELRPRTQIVAAPYALHAGTADRLSTDTIDGSLVVTGSFSAGMAEFTGAANWYDAGSPDARITLDPTFSRVAVAGADATTKINLDGSAPSGLLEVHNDNALPTVALDGGGEYGGQAMLYRSDGDDGVYFRGGSAALNEGGSIDLWGTAAGSLPTISLYGSKVGDQSVILPDGAINSVEIEDEPGIASAIEITPQALTSTMSDLVIVTINIPAHGYVVLQASAQFETSGTTNINDVYMQIDDAAGGNLIPGQFVTFGLGSYAGTGSNFFALSTQRIFFRTVGTFTFRLEGFFSSGGGTASCQMAKIAAIYYPTNYGAVATSSAEPGDSPDAQMINSAELPRGAESKLGQGYEVDLSILEQRVREARAARIEAEQAQRQAERDLAEARRKAKPDDDRSQR